MLQAEGGRSRGQLILLTAVLVHIWLRLHVACNNADATPLACHSPSHSHSQILAVVPHAYDNSGVTPLGAFTQIHMTLMVDQSSSML